MSNKFAMRALDKVSIMLTMPADLSVRLNRLSRQTNLSKQTIINGWVSEGLDKAGIQLTKEDLDEVNRISADNLAKRNAKKAEKGMGV